MTTVQPTAAVSTTASSTPASSAVALRVARLERRERDFGTGYGRSSGYASQRRYTSPSAPPRFRVA